jgi:hypothetical protein
VQACHELELDARAQFFRTHPPSRWLSLPARSRKHTHAHRLAHTHTHTPSKRLTLDCTLHTRAAHATLALNPLRIRPTASPGSPHMRIRDGPIHPASHGPLLPEPHLTSHTARCGPRLLSPLWARSAGLPFSRNGPAHHSSPRNSHQLRSDSDLPTHHVTNSVRRMIDLCLRS